MNDETNREQLKLLVAEVIRRAIEAKRGGYWSKDNADVQSLISAVGNLEFHLLDSAVAAFIGDEK